mgnify:CR=1 FL=1
MPNLIPIPIPIPIAIAIAIAMAMAMAIAMAMFIVDRENGVLLESGVVVAEVGGVWNRFVQGNFTDY